jgi:signal transduction histidine kinase
VAALGRTIGQLRTSIETLLAESGLNAKDTEAFDLGEMVNESVTVLRPQAVVQQVTLQSDVPSAPAPVSGKRAQLRQAVLAVAVNALESMPSGGEMSVDLERSSSRWIVSIADHGPGISADIAAKLFKMPFSTKPNRSGVGLFVARRIAEAHGGALDLDSTTGGGTRARLSVPADEER